MSTASRSPLDSLADPSPPSPDAATRAAVQERAHQILRRRRLALGAGSLACTALLAVGVVALVAPSGSGPTREIQTASAPEPRTTVTTAAPTTTVPAAAPAAPTEPVPPVEVPAAAEAPAPSPTPPAAAQEPPPAPVLSALTITVAIPEGATLQVTITGPSGGVTATSTSGTVSFSDLGAGSYEIFWSWLHPDGSQQVYRDRTPVVLGEGEAVTVTY